MLVSRFREQSMSFTLATMPFHPSVGGFESKARMLGFVASSIKKKARPGKSRMLARCQNATGVYSSGGEDGLLDSPRIPVS